MDVVTRAEGDSGAEARRPAPPTEAEAADATLYQDVVFLYRLVPGTHETLICCAFLWKPATKRIVS